MTLLAHLLIPAVAPADFAAGLVGSLKALLLPGDEAGLPGPVTMALLAAGLLALNAAAARRHHPRR
jgi:hypothetical protein